MGKNLISDFLFPHINKAFLIRIAILSGVTFLIFRYCIMPIRVQGLSMEPTITHDSFHFYSKIPYHFGDMKYGDIVVAALAGDRVLLLKRIVGLPGDTIAFVDGKLIRNDVAVEESYLHYSENWNLSPKEVKEGKVYIVGDNRGVSIEKHRFGQVTQNRILGKVIF